MLFAYEERKKLPNGGKGVRVTDTMVDIGKAWSLLCCADKDKYKDLSLYLIEKYCVSELDEAVESEIKKSRKKSK